MGVWQGPFEAPWDWREANRQGQPQSVPQNQPPSPGSTSASPAATSYLIKGNINSKGERIYHVPGGEYYDATAIDPAKGERWFCTEADAVAAGWRKSKL